MIDFFLAKHHISRTNVCRKKTRAETPSSENHTELGVSALYLALLSANISSGYVMLCKKKVNHIL